MKHCILCKFKPEVKQTDWQAMLPDIEKIFDKTLSIDGVEQVELITNCVDRDNRYDLLIRMTMTREALPAYDACPAHAEWKNSYGNKLEKKAIFDYEA
ncbi:MAG: Dabb family protein [Clostridia bacterium]|nr:Dabb family protein [Clostridia bacterium]